MWIETDNHCAEMLLDLLCYESKGGRLSPEIKHLLDHHLRECLCCRRKVGEFEQDLQESQLCPNFG